MTQDQFESYSELVAHINSVRLLLLRKHNGKIDHLNWYDFI